jgi:hypothetical protein
VMRRSRSQANPTPPHQNPCHTDAAAHHVGGMVARCNHDK